MRWPAWICTGCPADAGPRPVPPRRHLDRHHRGGQDGPRHAHHDRDRLGQTQNDPGRPVDRGHLPAGPVPGRWHLRAEVAAALGGGWDPANNEYQATIAGNYGPTDVVHGRLDAVWLSLPVAG